MRIHNIWFCNSNEYPQHVFLETYEKYIPDTHSYLDLWSTSPVQNLGQVQLEIKA